MAPNLLIFWVFSSYRPHPRSCAVSLTTPYIYQVKNTLPWTYFYYAQTPFWASCPESIHSLIFFPTVIPPPQFSPVSPSVTHSGTPLPTAYCLNSLLIKITALNIGLDIRLGKPSFSLSLLFPTVSQVKLVLIVHCLNVF